MSNNCGYLIMDDLVDVLKDHDLFTKEQKVEIIQILHDVLSQNNIEDYESQYTYDSEWGWEVPDSEE